MKIIVTGGLGHISQPLTEILVKSAHRVTVISRNPERSVAIERLGATAAIGSITDTPFLTEIFQGAGAVYTMVPPPSNYFDPGFDMVAHAETVRQSYFQALQQAHVPLVVNLSSWGAHRASGIGAIAQAHYTEKLLNQLPAKVIHIRPTSFYYNMLSFIPMIKHTGRIALNYGDDDMVSLVAPEDIATVIAEEILNPGEAIRYVASDELSCNRIAAMLGAGISLPELQWIKITDEEAKNNLLMAGLPPAMAESFVEMQAAIRKGLLAEDYIHHKPVFGNVKIADFAKDFAIAFHKA